MKKTSKKPPYIPANLEQAIYLEAVRLRRELERHNALSAMILVRMSAIGSEAQAKKRGAK